jgi:hypothetical protein
VQLQRGVLVQLMPFCCCHWAVQQLQLTGPVPPALGPVHVLAGPGPTLGWPAGVQLAEALHHLQRLAWAVAEVLHQLHRLAAALQLQLLVVSSPTEAPHHPC